MLNFAEELMLLVLDEATGELREPRPAILGPALAGAVLMDLALLNRIDTDVHNLYIIRPDPTEDPLLDNVLEQIGRESTPRSTRHWVETIGAQGGELRDAALAGLLFKGVLRCEESRFLWMFTSRRYPTQDGTGRLEIRSRMRELLQGNELPEPRDIVLVSLLNACRLFDPILDASEQSRLQRRIQAIARMDLIGQAFTAVIREIEHELILAMGHLG